MITFNYQTKFDLKREDELNKWICNTIIAEGFVLGEVGYVFCKDDYLHEINLKYLQHDTYTDVISFDYSVGKRLHGEIYISIDRIVDNARSLNLSADDELHRVMIHGILHYCGYNDKTEDEAQIMRAKEDYYLDVLQYS